MSPDRFIARKLKFQGKLATVSIAVSFLVIIIAVAVSSGFLGGEDISVRLHAVGRDGGSVAGLVGAYEFLVDVEPEVVVASRREGGLCRGAAQQKYQCSK